MSFVDDVDSLKTKLHLRDMPTSLRIGLVLLGAIILFILFQGLWQLTSGDTHLIDGSAQSSWQEGSEEGLTVTQAEAAQEGTEASTSQPVRLSVHVVGEVANPGLYEVDAGSRVQAAIDAAGGFTNDANQGSVNLAREIVDGEQIVVASKSASAAGAAGAGSAGSAATASSGASGAGSSSAPGGLVNINTADIAGLSSLSGIGEATAKKIIADREKNGPFKTTKDITRVSGIGDKKYEAIKDSITV